MRTHKHTLLMSFRTHSYLVLLGLAVAAVVLVAVLALAQRAPQGGGAAPAVTSPLAARHSPLPTPAMPAAVPAVQPASPLPIAAPTPATALSAPDAATPVYSYRVVAEYPHAPDAFTQGLQYIDGVLYEGTGLHGASSLRRVDLETGTVLQSVPLEAAYFGEGIAVVDDRIVQLTWQSNVGFVYDRKSLARIGQFSYPTEGWGITFDGKHLIMSDGTSTLYRWDAQTMEEVGRIEVTDQGEPVMRLNELEMVKGEIWANIWQTDRIARIDPATGQVAGWIDLAGLLSAEDRVRPVDVLNGIAYDAAGDRLFVTGKLWPKLFEIELLTAE